MWQFWLLATVKTTASLFRATRLRLIFVSSCEASPADLGLTQRIPQISWLLGGLSCSPLNRMPPLPPSDRKKKPRLFVQLTDFHANAQIYGWRLNVNTAFSRYRITVLSCCFAFRTNGKLFTFSDAFSSTVRQNNRVVKWRKWGRNYKMTVWGIRELVSYRATADRKSSVSPTDLITCLFEWRALHSNQVTGTPTHTSWLVAAVYVLCLSVNRFRYFNPLSHTDAHGDSQCTCMHAFKPDQVTTDGEVGNRCRQADPGLSGHNIITGPAGFFSMQELRLHSYLFTLTGCCSWHGSWRPVPNIWHIKRELDTHIPGRRPTGPRSPFWRAYGGWSTARLVTGFYSVLLINRSKCNLVNNVHVIWL